MLNAIYTLAFVISFIYLAVLLTAFKSRVSVYFVMLFVTITITNFGCMQMSDANDIRLAVYSNQVVYLGGSFSSFFLMMCISDLCKIKIKTPIKFILLALSFFILTCASTIGVSDLYYKKIEIVERFGVHYLKKTYGPIHILYPMYLFFSVGYSYVILIKSFVNKKLTSYKNSALLIFLMAASSATYALEKITDIDIPLIPFSYLISQTIILVILNRVSLYDVRSYSSDFLNDTKSAGFMMCDSRGKFLGSDETAIMWFPEISTLKIDYPINEKDSRLLSYVNECVQNPDAAQEIMIENGNKFYQIKHSIKLEHKTRKIHCIYIRDDTQNQIHMKFVESYNIDLEKAVDRKTEKLQHIQNDIIVGMASIVENRDNNTGGHIARTSDVVNIFVAHLMENNLTFNHNDVFWRNVIKAAPLHDFGKIAIPDVILNKPGKFTDEEYSIMKQHPSKGAKIVDQILRNSEDMEFKKIAVNVAHYHHEKWNGSGYPKNIAGEEIPLEARVMALADVFDALVSKRVYKEKFSYDDAFRIIEESSGSHFDPTLCSEFLKCRRQLETLYDSYTD